MQGYIERTGDDEWLTTDSGTAVSGSKPPRFTREAVAPALSALGERIRAANHDPKAPFHIGMQLHSATSSAVVPAFRHRMLGSICSHGS